MSENATTSTDSTAPTETPWTRLADAEPIRVRDPLAEALGMVPEGEPLVVPFAEVVTAAGHACPAVAGAYRGTQLALEVIYPDGLPVRSEIAVVVGGEPDAPGLGPMANVIRQVTGAADESGFAGFGDFGGRDELLTFGTVDAPGRAFRFARTDTGATVTVSFDPSQAGVDPDDGGGEPMRKMAAVVSGEASDEEAAAVRDAWHERVQQILQVPAEGGPFTVTGPE